MNKFVIEEKMPSLNDVIRANRSVTYHKGASFKKKYDGIVKKYINKAIRDGTLRKVDGQVILNLTYHEKTKRRDADNIVSAKKFILDALVESGILVDDNRKYVKGFNEIIVDDKKDFIEVEIIDVETIKKGS